MTVSEPLHSFTCAYCTGDGAFRREWTTRRGFEHHMRTFHHGLRYEPMWGLAEEMRAEAAQTVSEPRTPEGFRDLMSDHTKAELIDLLYVQTEAAVRAEAAQPIAAERLVDIIEQAIFETDTGLAAALLAAERIARLSREEGS